MRKKSCLTSEDVHKIISGARAFALKNKWNVTIAVVDEAGYLWHLDRLDGAGSTTPEVAIGKARTAALTKQPSRQWEDRVKERPVFLNYPTEILIWGGLPVFYEGECVGGVGVSGVASQDDERVAQAGIDALA